MCIALGSGAYMGSNAEARPSGFERRVLSGDRPKLSDAQTLFFNARYDAAAALTLDLRALDPEDLAIWELHTSGLLFQLNAALDGRPDKEKAFKQCVGCPELLTAFLSDTARGVALARERLQSIPWMPCSNAIPRTSAPAWRAWIDDIVDTKMPFGTKWLFGGGNRKRALLTMHDAASAEADFFVHAEARFALWDLHVRERNVPAAIRTARGLAEDFPENRELATYLETHDRETSSAQPTRQNVAAHRR